MIPISLLIVCGTLESGGAERVISILSEQFANEFKQVTILTWRESSVFYNIDQRVKIISLPSIAKSDNFIFKCIAFRRFVKSNSISVILSFITLFNMCVLLSLKHIDIPIIVAERNDPRFVKGGKFIKQIRDILYRKATGILCQTNPMAEYYNKRGFHNTKVIFNPANLSSKIISLALRTEKKNKIVCVGRLDPQKNYKLMLDSFKLFHEKYPDYVLEIFGCGELQDYIKASIAENRLTEHVVLMGAQKDVINKILNAQMFVMTSKYEGMSNALIEAMCVGLPCISTKVSGATDLIEDNVNGILVNDDPHQICAAMSEIINNPEFAYKLGKNATEIYSRLSSYNISPQWIEYIQKIYNSAYSENNNLAPNK